ncbi:MULTISPECIES: phosphoribosyl-ATP diphosphatase [Rhizobium]|uniref:Phosphoribosyl-ATP pyrophosphatase n=1 Tax=Rhizobium rhododendri TaxID=2506430 RepID=A0ABY8IHJ3_9HYPH|nr:MULTISPECIES: phosphoribosyl-ATP diphosphatase [Rhizobium]MBZ5760558.1 phosphoribosyl-ATP diphosphatase [Rhizobium sp. VS19-DR96]MBZ5765658.1 phosphoribosyl-ATP diphosphatase [Rhizobium sp. VS19-DR129.2]MBZ5774577.1 phosphoribosyl-ATP diphosphatase [Rhizobium sp. VS19-DRK62.2]MBZ5784393.1 phosphoribosyl-ATP diphosphatase [Rhizobium sp. VS19-DR121]MBZ5801005.1 phosphoribosyl-ATP diphosphatase [Rhizobium sp. VS19-DR181]
MSGFTLSDLEKIVDQRSRAGSDESWTAKLVAGGQAKAAKKLGEEAIEAVMAAVVNDRENLTYEAADLLYHLMVVLKIAEIPLNDVLAELERRTLQSGLTEKAGRQSS